MDRLKLALLELEIASAEEVDDALARQQLYGGDLLTNLLEVRSLTEGQALHALARAYGLPTVNAGQLPYASAVALETLGRDVLVNAAAYPIEKTEQGLVLVVGHAPSEELQTRLSQQAHAAITWCLAVPARIYQALYRDFALPLERRVHKAIARLEGNEIFSSSRAPHPLAEAPRFSELPRPQSLVPGTFFADWSENETPRHEAFLAETAPQPAVRSKTERGVSAASLAFGETQRTTRLDTQSPYRLAAPPVPSRDLIPQRATSSKPASSNHVSEPSRRGPYALAQARRDLATARTAEQILRIAFTYTTQFFDFLAAFTLRENAAHLKRTRGLPDSNPAAGALLLSESKALERAANERKCCIVAIGDSPALQQRLGLSSDRRVAVLPVPVRHHTAILMVGGFDLGQPNSRQLKEATEFVPFVSHALERIILLRKSRPPTG